jgi:CheY-like chemotaxis protein/AraC-like DNA-binding protein
MEKYLSEMKLRFFTDISHEIRMPLTMISGQVEYLLSDEETPEKAKSRLNSISQNANRMLKLLDRILDFRKIRQSGLKIEEINADAFIENICSDFKEIAQKNHSGKIYLVSEPGKGSTLTIYIMKGIKHFDENVEFVETEQNTDSRNKENMLEYNIADEKRNKKPTILIVEDNEEFRQFIKTVLEHNYSVIEADNGSDGLEKALKLIPDFIVSDIMMPGMDGIELLQKLKNNINTSHIPVILLTAKTAIENKLEGLTCGADDYITKPFSVRYFQARIDNLLEQRKRIQETFRSQLTEAGKPEFELPLSSISFHDENFIGKVIEILDKHIADGEFTIDNICEIIGMSRSVFSNKIKSLTGIPPFDFIRDLKMKRAAHLLASGKFMVKEVSFMVGISDVKHFGKIFKSKFGLTPQEYKKELRTKN